MRGPETRTQRLCALLLLACALWPLHGSPPVIAGSDPQAGSAPEWPREWEGRPLRPLALSPVERRFASGFPGHIARLTDGRRVLVLREVLRPTRMLHPAADCYQGLGYRVAQAHLERDANRRLWRCFVAERGGQRLRVCERITDRQDNAFTDTSAWFWAAQMGQTSGPWLAVTLAEPWVARTD